MTEYAVKESYQVFPIDDEFKTKFMSKEVYKLLHLQSIKGYDNIEDAKNDLVCCRQMRGLRKIS